MAYGFFSNLRDDSKLSSISPIHPRVLEFILVASFIITTLLLIIPFEYIDGNPVPTIFFKGLPTTFQAFVVCLVFSFSGSLSALLIHDTSLLAKFCEYTSMASMTSALSLLLCTMFGQLWMSQFV
ncbi:hypothetical protein CsSME_00018867 [Camellia sinensis var. sinensis]